MAVGSPAQPGSVRAPAHGGRRSVWYLAGARGELESARGGGGGGREAGLPGGRALEGGGPGCPVGLGAGRGGGAARGGGGDGGGGGGGGGSWRPGALDGAGVRGALSAHRDEPPDCYSITHWHLKVSTIPEGTCLDRHNCIQQ